MKSIENVSLMDILPASIKDDAKIKAVAEGLDADLKKLSAETRLTLHLPRLEELPHEVLDALAFQFHIDFYEPERMNIETKRLLVSEAIHQHRKYGTKFAIEKLLNTLSNGAKVIEWFNYKDGTGKPYHFKINLKGLKDLEDDGERIIAAIEVTKSVRDNVDDFDFDLSKEHPDEILHFGFADIEQGNHIFNLNTKLEDTHDLKVVHKNISSGNNFFNLDFKTKNKSCLRAGFINIQHGNIIFKTEVDVDDGLWYSLWNNWIKAKWKAWKNADIIYYKPEEPIDDDDEDDVDEFTLSGNFIKIWFDYHNDDKVRLLVMHNARDNLTANDINAVNVDGLFINRRGHLSNKVIRSSFVHRDITMLKF